MHQCMQSCAAEVLSQALCLFKLSQRWVIWAARSFLGRQYLQGFLKFLNRENVSALYFLPDTSMFWYQVVHSLGLKTREEGLNCRLCRKQPGHPAPRDHTPYPASPFLSQTFSCSCLVKWVACHKQWIRSTASITVDRWLPRKKTGKVGLETRAVSLMFQLNLGPCDRSGCYRSVRF